MRLPRDRLVFLALCVLDDTVAATSKAPVPPSDPLRLALAILYAFSDGPLFDWGDHRAIFDKFWRVVVGAEDCGHTQREYIRQTMATTCLHQIERQVRMSDAVARARVKRSQCRSAVLPRQIVSEDGRPATVR